MTARSGLVNSVLGCSEQAPAGREHCHHEVEQRAAAAGDGGGGRPGGLRQRSSTPAPYSWQHVKPSITASAPKWFINGEEPGACSRPRPWTAARLARISTDAIFIVGRW